MPIRASSLKTNTKLRGETLGEIELRHFRSSDSGAAIKLLNDVKNGKEYTTRVLHNQLAKPEVSYEEFAELPDQELRTIARAFIGNETSMFRAFEETNDEELFDNFRGAIEKGLLQFAELLRPHQADILAIAGSFAELTLRAASSVHQAVKYFQSDEFQKTSVAQVLKVIGEFSRIQQAQLNSLRPAIAPALSSLEPEQLKAIADFSNYFTASRQDKGFLYDVHRLASQMVAAPAQTPPTTFSKKLARGMTEVIESGEKRAAVEQLVQDKIATLPKDRDSLIDLKLIVAVISMLISLANFYLIYSRHKDSKASSELQNRIVLQEEAQTEYLRQIAKSIEGLIENSQHLRVQVEGNNKYYSVYRRVDLKVKPINKSDTIVSLEPGQRVKLIQRRHQWIEVALLDYLEAIPLNGWVLKKYLRMNKN